MKHPIITATNISKEFKLPHERPSGLKQALITFKPGGEKYEVQKVLKDISFEINQGDFFGIVGRNGSGKSTLLKLLAGVYTPNTGTIEVRGSLTPFIELGVGFNPELTGRENIFLNGALLGFDHKQMEAKYDQIVEFAELERFMDQKLKNYSSGMQVRLAFSIAIQAQSDILVLDEVLAVGDEAFQKKCTRVFESYKAAGRTVVLVTHDMSAVERFCNKAMLIADGEIVQVGDPGMVAKQYSVRNSTIIQDADNRHLSYVTARSQRQLQISVTDKAGKSTNTIKQGGEIGVELNWQGNDIKNVGLALLKQTGEYLFGTNTFVDNFKLTGTSVQYRLRANLGPGEYIFKIALFGETEDVVHEFIESGPVINVVAGSLPAADPNYQMPQSGWQGLTYLDHRWDN